MASETARENVVVCDNGTGVRHGPLSNSLSLSSEGRFSSYEPVLSRAHPR